MSTIPLMTIGLFSRSSLLSVKALRAYHESGLLVPERVDPRSGYRAYHPAQLHDAGIIRRLRDLDVPLPEIARVLRARDPATTREVLAGHEARMRRRLEETARIVDDLADAVRAPGDATPVRVRPVAHTYALAHSDAVDHDDFPTFFAQAFPRLYAAVAQAGTAPTGPPGGLFPAVIVDDPQEVTAYVPVAGPPEAGGPTVAATLVELPAGHAACLAHKGPYEDLGAAYAALGAWAAHHAEPTGEPVRERYLVGPGDTPDPADFRTELVWPVRVDDSIDVTEPTEPTHPTDATEPTEES